ncbi:argininosuccinate lyase [Candidatus Bathyarchaeota archaeon]|nr:MAG: argininosuccinate lyase [Candidatus Bathyarchaeota archaeon]
MRLRRQEKKVVSDLLRKGRLKPARRDAILFVSSTKDDKKILKQIIEINKAHIVMLVENEIIDEKDGGRILQALDGLKKKVRLRPEHEDAHVAIEEGVIRTVGEEIGGNLNLAKSRNDQVATAIRMNLRREILKTAESIVNLQEALLKKADRNIETIIPGYTHMQPAQPITFAHYLLAQFDALQRDLNRLREAYVRVDLCPMGAGALATTSFPIKRERIAELLGFSGILENSLDAVSTRDFLLETLAVLSILAVNVTRIAEDLIVWSTMEFRIVELPDELAFTSSIMPQKKNPDVLEVIRSRMSNILGEFISSATLMKALPTGYNLDFQEATPKLWSATETVQRCLKMLSEIILNLKVHSVATLRSDLSFLAATEIANMLVRDHNVPFRTAHRIVGALVKNLVENELSLGDLTPKLFAEVSGRFLKSPLKVEKEELMRIVDLSKCVESYNVKGGPSKIEVERMLKERWKTLTDSKGWIRKREDKLRVAEKTLRREIEMLIRKTCKS